MTVGAALTAAKKAIISAAIKAGQIFLGMSVMEVAKVAVLIGVSVATIIAILKFLKDKKKMMSDEKNKTPYDKMRESNDYADLRKQKDLHPSVKKSVKKAFKKELKPRYKKKYKKCKKVRRAESFHDMSFEEFARVYENINLARMNKDKTFEMIDEIRRGYERTKAFDDYRDAHPTGHELVDWIKSPACFGGLYNPE